jgi:hypothetical protein
MVYLRLCEIFLLLLLKRLFEHRLQTLNDDVLLLHRLLLTFNHLSQVCIFLLGKPYFFSQLSVVILKTVKQLGHLLQLVL